MRRYSGYNLTQPVRPEPASDVGGAIVGEKQLKSRRRGKKVALAGPVNPEVKELARRWYGSDSVFWDPSLHSG